jgi:hypothetical protein
MIATQTLWCELGDSIAWFCYFRYTSNLFDSNKSIRLASLADYETDSDIRNQIRRSRAEAEGNQQTLFSLNEQVQKLGDFRNQLI